MVELTGSEKQVKWANEIRAKMIENLNRTLAQTTGKLEDYRSGLQCEKTVGRDGLLCDFSWAASFSGYQELFDAVLAYNRDLATLNQVNSQSDAKWFIDNRNGVKLQSDHLAEREARKQFKAEITDHSRALAYLKANFPQGVQS